MNVYVSQEDTPWSLTGLGSMLKSPWQMLGKLLNNTSIGTSLVAQWLRIRLPMQWTWVRALVQEDPTCRGATKPVHYSY